MYLIVGELLKEELTIDVLNICSYFINMLLIINDFEQYSILFYAEYKIDKKPPVP